MRHGKRISAAGLAALALAVCGAPAAAQTAGEQAAAVARARAWQHAGDIALVKGRLEIAYDFYGRAAETFPGTRHGNLAERRMRRIRAALSRPARSPARENVCTWAGEFFDFLTWP